MSKIFSQSPDMKKEYCCSVVRIGEILPIEGKDVIGQTLVNGFPVVVRKDQVKEGQLMFYAAVETQLNPMFLRANSLYEDPSMNADNTKKGYFNKYGRVRIVKLGGVPSMGYLFDALEMFAFTGDSAFLPEQLEVGMDFDTVKGEQFVKAYVPLPKVQRQSGGGKGAKRNKQLKKFDRMIPGEFAFHYDTDQLERNMFKIKPEDVVDLSVKLHGTSAIIGNIRVREPKWGGLYAKYFCYLPKFLQRTIEKYDYIYSSRTVIKNHDINTSVSDGFYGTDLWADYQKIFKDNDLLARGMTIYGEIVGFTSNGSAIQKVGNAYDYGCAPGKNKLMIYRITQELDGKLYEANVQEVYEWTCQLVNTHPELRELIHPIDVVYHGTLKDLYPDVDVKDHWHENVLERLKNEKRFGMEEDEPLCKNKVPREGLVLRIENDPLKEAFKLKTMKFRFGEAKAIDAGQTDIEMEQAYGE